ncbi:glycine--tRNA ligase subunit beta [Paracoccus denitrificans]|jgi:glycyl-tRNA synthetase beta chain|uniref:Glycine--tRNA ligase beta subunit n=1 Tax=Paracoccus denitrificans (strain Pd 1222) TaxID=318586 RepID=SYGB_PARDP|nr:glycine--tRNA ligase subunit beta [Paracoccus denitrificans]A1AZF8.1 RecName: Full=Glycine--tRNA ligase beta subunit; AltName: Full=Glycyl-tRNA synthetase beta subunit; Short=GlyRS [Paracoccus denitrificans PD1222]ABL68652.1 glycyl-tRNA synthetase beta chain [Paracoccus denitrificans PD1222]MBB4625622.1 glycyl-tRNA synthetase beta chain [Paracoccus denitrificans]MCU7427209.1 glycine--tRNA ligase subunit beta [Paracoccus denitrificans]QAR26710.1 glycine--tRNA ligase subunit beta [Paracoccus 
MPDLLIELFSEEIPARMQARARGDLKKLVTDGLVEAGLTYKSAGAFSTPRRLALAIEGLTAQSPTTREERKGPRTDAPEAALEGFLRSTGLTREQLEARDDKKGQVWFAVVTKPGRPAAEIVAEVLERAIRDFPWPKSMRWGSGSLRWVRPLHSIICLLSDESGASVVPLEIEGIGAGNTTRGHRFMAPDEIAVSGFEDYAAKLRRARVMLDAAEREAAIRQEAANLAFARGWEIVPDEGLLSEVAGLVEWPVPLMGAIEDRFLALPPEVLQTSMKEHQKFFSARNPKTGRIEGFVTVANIETPDHGETILKGNQRVLAARLSDAAFFWENDLREAKAGMADWAEGLRSVTFQSKLGSQADRIARIAALALEIAPLVGADADQAEQAARIAKLDLRSAMVGEFPELQGIMGRYYALEAGLPEPVADAARDHYSPLGPSDAVPSAPVSVAVALADKLDTLTGFWAIDEKPTGSKDPFALRRAALGVIRLLLVNGVRANLGQTFAKARPDADAADLLAFFHDRLKVHLRDQGVRHDIIDAVLSMPGNDDLVLLVNRATALSDVLKTEDGTNLLQGLKRAGNILAQAEEMDGVEYSFGADPKFAETDEERTLFAALDKAEPAIREAVRLEDFQAATQGIASLRAPIDAFFEAVQINSDNQILRRNRLNLLSRIRDAGRLIADFGRIEG